MVLMKRLPEIFCRSSLIMILVMYENEKGNNQWLLQNLKAKITEQKQATPIGLYWDFENVHVPRKKSGFALIQKILETIYEGNLEDEFILVWDTYKEDDLLDEISEAQVYIINTKAPGKNAVDEKLKTKMRFVHRYGAKSTLVLLSRDVNFAPDLYLFKFTYNPEIIIIFEGTLNSTLKACANKTYEISIFTDELPSRRKVKETATQITVTRLPTEMPTELVKQKLQALSENTGGKIIAMNTAKCSAIIEFHGVASA